MIIEMKGVGILVYDMLYTRNMKVSVDPKKCIGCGLCPSIAEEVFELFENKTTMIAKVKANADLKKYAKETKEAKESCPVEAISVEE